MLGYQDTILLALGGSVSRVWTASVPEWGRQFHLFVTTLSRPQPVHSQEKRWLLKDPAGSLVQGNRTQLSLSDR